MCNLYSLTKGQAAIRDLFRALQDRTGNLPLFPGIFPDQMAPIVRTGVDSERELVTARWGMPGPPQYGGAPVTNIRNVSSPHWQGWLGKRNRCLVPATSFCEYADAKPRKTPIWFALDVDRPLFAFAGLWASWRGLRGPKSVPVHGEHQLFGFLTTEANAIVAPIHPKAMPVILTTPGEFDQWLEADTIDALVLQRPLPDDHYASSRRARRRTEAPSFRCDPHQTYRHAPAAQSKPPCRPAAPSARGRMSRKGGFLPSKGRVRNGRTRG
jgi:putative SOS response-associated peptidase YedK